MLLHYLLSFYTHEGLMKLPCKAKGLHFEILPQLCDYKLYIRRFKSSKWTPVAVWILKNGNTWTFKQIKCMQPLCLFSS